MTRNNKTGVQVRRSLDDSTEARVILTLASDNSVTLPLAGSSTLAFNLDREACLLLIRELAQTLVDMPDTGQ